MLNKRFQINGNDNKMSRVKRVDTCKCIFISMAKNDPKTFEAFKSSSSSVLPYLCSISTNLYLWQYLLLLNVTQGILLCCLKQMSFFSHPIQFQTRGKPMKIICSKLREHIIFIVDSFVRIMNRNRILNKLMNSRFMRHTFLLFETKLVLEWPEFE